MDEEKDIAKFKDLYHARFGIELDDELARQKLVLLVKQMEVVYQPIRFDDVKNVNMDVKANETTEKV